MKQTRTLSRTYKACLIFALLGLVLVCLLGGGYWLFFRGTAEPLVMFHSPESGGVVELNAPVAVEASGFYARGMERLELYADGALLANQDSTLPGGSNPLVLSDNWIPTTPGRHLLMVRGYSRDQRVVDSNVVIVQVVASLGDTFTGDSSEMTEEGGDLPSLNDIAEGLGVPPERIGKLNPDLPREGPLPPRTPVILPRPPRPAPPPGSPPVPMPGLPGMPTILGADTATCGQVRLTWIDVPDEIHYVIFRLSPGDTFFGRLDDRPANTTSYTDSSARSGTNYYQVEARNARGGTLSAVYTVNARPGCPPTGPAGTNDLLLTWFTLDTGETFDGVYCYVSVNGGRYERVPRLEPAVMRPSADGLTYHLPPQLPSRGHYVFAEPASGLVTVDMECWGQAGGTARLIGRISGSHARPEWDGRDQLLTAFTGGHVASLESTGGYALRVHYRIGPNWLSSLTPPNPIDPALLGPLEPDYSMLVPSFIERADLPAPTNVRLGTVLMPGPCRVLPTEDSNVVTRVCDDLGVLRLLWNWSANSTFTESNITGYRVLVRVTDLSGASPRTTMTHNYTVQPGSRKNANPPAFPITYTCGYVTRITVQAYVEGFESPESAPLTFTTPPCTARPRVTITIQNLVVGPSSSTGEVLDDDFCFLCADRRMEIWNYYSIWPGVAHVFVHEFNPGNFFSGNIGRGGVLLREGQYSYGGVTQAALLLRQFTYSPAPGETLTIVFNLFDSSDSGNHTDFWCEGRAELRARSAIEWQRAADTVEIRDDQGEASCRFIIEVRGSPRP